MQIKDKTSHSEMIADYRIDIAVDMYKQLLTDYSDIMSIARKQAVREIRAELKGIPKKENN